MKHASIWTGDYRGIRYEIRNWDLHGIKDAWAFYLYLYPDCLGESANLLWLEPQQFGRHIIYDDDLSSGLANLEWHLGCTFYEKVAGFDGSRRTVKVGCDYNHASDDVFAYTAQSIESDAMMAIDSFYNLFPTYQDRQASEEKNNESTNTITAN